MLKLSKMLVNAATTASCVPFLSSRFNVNAYDAKTLGSTFVLNIRKFTVYSRS